MENKPTRMTRKERKLARTPEEKKRRKRKRRIIWLSIITSLVMFRVFLPYMVLHYVNDKLANLEEYYGHVDDIDIHLFRGAYEIKDMRIMKKVENGNTEDTIPFFAAPSIDLSIEWNSLFGKSIVGKVNVDKPVINFVKENHKGEDVRADTADFAQLVKDLMPLTINRFNIHEGEIHYRDLDASPKLDLVLNKIEITGTNLSNVTNSKEVLPATLQATAEAYQGKFEMNVKFDGLAGVPTFDMNMEFKGLNLVLLNDMLREYANFDVKKGTFSMYGEFAAKDNKFGGYVKPFLKDMDVVQWNREEGNLRQILWETIVSAGVSIVKNKHNGQVATKIPISGSFDNMHLNKWHAISYVLRNGFLKALRPSLDNSININRLEDGEKPTFLEKVFTKDQAKKNRTN